MSTVYTMKGNGDFLEVYEDKVTITPKGVLGFLGKGLQGAKTIPFFSITGIRFKETGLVAGYLHFTVHDVSDKGVLDIASHENTFMFAGIGV